MAGTEENPIVYPPLEMPAGVEREKITIWNMGLGLDGDIYRPKDIASDSRLPGIALSHGIGGDKYTCERYAALFAAADMICISFSQASWGESQGRLALAETSDKPFIDAETEVTTGVKMTRDLVDPLDWIDCYLSVVDYLCGEPNVDDQRIGAWGTSFGGGTAACAAALDERIKALSIQVPAVINAPPEMAAMGQLRAKQIARGEVAPVPTGADTLPGLPGSINFARMVRYKAGDMVEQIKVPTLIIDAENEEMFDISQSGGRAYENLQSRGIESYYEVLPDIDHYGIYFGGFERGSQLALDWFQRHL